MIRLIEINERKVNLNPHFEGPCPFLTPGQVLRQKGCVCLEGGFRKPIREHKGVNDKCRVKFFVVYENTDVKVHTCTAYMKNIDILYIIYIYISKSYIKGG